MSIEKKLVALVLLPLLWGCSTVKEPPETPESVEAANIAHYEALAAEDPKYEVQYLLVRHWLRGEYEQALPRFKELADEGQYTAALMVVSAYRHGLGTAPDAEQARVWRERAIELTDDEELRALLTEQNRQPD